MQAQSTRSKNSVSEPGHSSPGWPETAAEQVLQPLPPELLEQQARSLGVGLELAFPIDGLQDVEMDRVLGNPTVEVTVDREKALRFGLEPDALARELRNRIQGTFDDLPDEEKTKALLQFLQYKQHLERDNSTKKFQDLVGGVQKGRVVSEDDDEEEDLFDDDDE